MLRCPKCSRIYQTGAQRFCTHDGGRLISTAEMNGNDEPGAAVLDSRHQSPTEFQPRKQTGRLVLPPSIEPAEVQLPTPKPAIRETPGFKSDSFNGFATSVTAAPPILERKPTGRLVLPTEIPDSFAPVGDRSINPTGRLPISPQNPDVLIGQNVKGRYTVDKILQQDELTVTYLGHDRLGEYRQVLIKIWLDRFPPEAEETRRFYEERGALSHLNHPNIARILDAGDLTEGKPFIITEFPEGLTLREAMQISGRFSAYRAARVVRQIAQALTEAHNNRLMHRHLKPENVVLKNDGKSEQVKVLNFGVAGDEAQDVESLAYTAPETLMGQTPHAENDIFALGVVAYEILTGRKPFSGANEDELLDGAELGLVVKPTSLRHDLSASVDAVLERALAFNRADRFHHAREFGEALNVALTENTVFQVPVVSSKTSAPPEKETLAAADAETPGDFAVTDSASAASGEQIAETPAVKTKNSGNKTPWLIAAIVLLAGIAALAAIFLYNKNRPTSQNEPAAATAPEMRQPNRETSGISVQPTPVAVEPTPTVTIETAVIPPNFVRFENSKTDLSGKLAEKFAPFSLAYPQNWQRSKNAGNFLDVSNRAPNNFPLEQLLVSWYESGGSFAADRGAFPSLAQKLTDVYAREIPDFRILSEGETTLNNRPAYEVKFAGKAADERGKTINVFGRTFFVPVEAANAKTGFTLTMLATDLSPIIASANDVGEKGELKEVLATFKIGASAAAR